MDEYDILRAIVNLHEVMTSPDDLGVDGDPRRVRALGPRRDFGTVFVYENQQLNLPFQRGHKEELGAREERQRKENRIRMYEIVTFSKFSQK